MFTHLLDAFDHQLQNQPDRLALVVASAESPGQVESISWRRLAAIVARSAEILDHEFTSNPALPRRIGHASDNTLGDLVMALASMSIDAVEVPIDFRLSETEIQSRWQRVGGYWLEPSQRAEIVDEARQHSFDRELELPLSIKRRRSDIDQPSLVLWTSGTTGRPQGVTLSQRNLCGNAAAKLLAVPQRGDDVRLCVLPLSHAYARTCDFGTWLHSGCTLAVTLGFAGWQQLGPRVLPTLANTVPRLADRLLAGDADSLGLARLRLLGCGGAAMDSQAFLRWKERGVCVIQGYGLTETSPVICSATPDQALPGLVGRFVDGWESEIRGGQLFVRGPHNMLGYWGDASATADKIDEQGWLETGDLVEQDAASGQLRILGRADDVLVLDSGRKLNPHPIERRLEQIAGIRHAMLVAMEGKLQLGLDRDADVDPVQIKSLLAELPAWQQPETVWQFQPPLSAANDELTNKGTIRRHHVMATRFSTAALKRGRRLRCPDLGRGE